MHHLATNGEKLTRSKSGLQFEIVNE